ncbi:MAG: TolC family protein, partial [Verrucomicrobia bacterium]|nr:TolC family protein [Verrucomicrobiota bacterium]
AGLGLNVSQLLTDFGRTANQVESVRQKSRAEDANVEATRNLLLLQVSSVYYLALQSQNGPK